MLNFLKEKIEQEYGLPVFFFSKRADIPEFLVLFPYSIQSMHEECRRYNGKLSMYYFKKDEITTGALDKLLTILDFILSLSQYNDKFRIQKYEAVTAYDAPERPGQKPGDTYYILKSDADFILAV